MKRKVSEESYEHGPKLTAVRTFWEQRTDLSSGVFVLPVKRPWSTTVFVLFKVYGLPWRLHQYYRRELDDGPKWRCQSMKVGLLSECLQALSEEMSEYYPTGSEAGEDYDTN